MDEAGKGLGPEFRKIRKAKGLTLKQASEGILSPSALSRWERDENDISVGAYSKLLNKWHVSPRELNQSKVNRRDVITQISILYIKNKNDELKKMAQELLTRYRQTQDFDDLLMAGTACNFYLDLSEEDLTDDAFKKDVFMQVKSIVDWHDDDIILFTNMQFMLTPELIYKTARNMLSKVYEFEIVPTAYAKCLSNAVFSLIKMKQIKYAEKLFNALKTLEFSEYRTEQSIHFFGMLLKYIHTGNDSEIKNYLSKKTTSHTKQQMLDDFAYSFNQIKEIYQK